jgi:hypothetical protein
MNRRPTTLEIRLDPVDLRRWQHHVVVHLATMPGPAPRVVAISRRCPQPDGLEILFSLEKLIGRGFRDAPVDRLDFDTLSRFAVAERPGDLVVDLIGDGEPPAGGLHLAITCGGAPVLDGAVAAIVDRKSVV